MKYKGIYYYDETDKGRTAQAVHKRDQSDAACGIYMFFMACANRVSAKWHRWTVFHMPAWFVVSVLGTVVLAVIGVFWLLKFVFVDFQYEEDESEGENEQ